MRRNKHREMKQAENNENEKKQAWRNETSRE